MKKIPKSIELAGITWKITRNDNKDGTFGHCCFLTNTINVRKKVEGKRLTRDQELHTFYHELAHATTYTMGREDLCADESFIDLIGNLNYQAEKSAKV